MAARKVRGLLRSNSQEVWGLYIKAHQPADPLETTNQSPQRPYLWGYYRILCSYHQTTRALYEHWPNVAVAIQDHHHHAVPGFVVPIPAWDTRQWSQICERLQENCGAAYDGIEKTTVEPYHNMKQANAVFSWYLPSMCIYFSYIYIYTCKCRNIIMYMYLYTSSFAYVYTVERWDVVVGPWCLDGTEKGLDALTTFFSCFFLQSEASITYA